jgi:hypothetical protein
MDYFSELEDQLGRITESGVHNRRAFGFQAPRPRGRLLAALASVLAVSAAIAVVLASGNGGTTRLRASPAPSGGRALQAGFPGHTNPGRTRTGAPADAYCANSITRAKVECSSQKVSPSPGYRGGFPAISAHPGSPTTLVAQLPLRAPSGAKGPAAVTEVVRQGATFGITIVAKGLAANTNHDVYAVWLANGPHPDKLLGFVARRVKKNGRLETAGTLPKNAFRYHKLLITLQTRANPTTPGAVALDGAFHR